MLDTGLLYRALTKLALQRQVPLEDGVTLAEIAQELMLVTRRTEEGQLEARVCAAGEDVTEHLFSELIDENVSNVARHTQVRSALLQLQRTPLADVEIVAG